MLETVALQRRIALLAIRMSQASRSYRALNKGDQAGRGSIEELPNKASSHALSIFVNGGSNQRLVQVQFHLLADGAASSFHGGSRCK